MASEKRSFIQVSEMGLKYYFIIIRLHFYNFITSRLLFNLNIGLRSAVGSRIFSQIFLADNKMIWENFNFIFGSKKSDTDWKLVKGTNEKNIDYAKICLKFNKILKLILNAKYKTFAYFFSSVNSYYCK